MITFDKIKDAIVGALRGCGLGGAEFLSDPTGADHFMIRTAEDYKIRADIYFKLEFDVRRLENPHEAEDEIRRVLRPLYDSMMASPEVAEMQRALNENHAEVRRLTPFATHYELEYQLRQGKKLEKRESP